MRNWTSSSNIEWKRRGIEKLKRSVPNSTVVKIQATHVLQWSVPSQGRFPDQERTVPKRILQIRHEFRLACLAVSCLRIFQRGFADEML
jgi:hypothetical protein